MDRQIKMGTVDEVRFTAKLSAKGKKAKWYMRNAVSNFVFSKLILLCFTIPVIDSFCLTKNENDF